MALLAKCSQIGPPPMFTCSAAWPVQSPQCARFNAAVGAKDAAAAQTEVAATASGRFNQTRQAGKKAMAQGSNSGRLLVLAPVNSAAESSERQASETRPDLRARSAKFTAASANTVLNMSLAMLPACKT